MTKTFPFPKLTEDELIWLNAVFKKNLAGEKFTDRMLVSELKNLLSEQFTPDSINLSLLWNGGVEIKLMGILAVERNLSFLEKIDSVVKAIRNAIMDNPSIEYVAYRDITDKISLNENEVSVILKILNELGHFGMYGRTDADGQKFYRVTGSDFIFPQYRRFESSERLVYSKLLNKPFPGDIKKEKENANPQTLEDLLKNNPQFEELKKYWDKKLASGKKIMTAEAFILAELARTRNEYLKPATTQIVFGLEVFNFTLYKKKAYDWLITGFGYSVVDHIVRHAKQEFFSRERFRGRV